MGFDFKLSELGDLRAAAEKDRTLFAESMWSELKQRGDAGLKAELRADVERSGMKNAKRLAKTWRAAVYPKAARAHAARPAYVASQKTPYLAGIFQQGGAIRAKNAFLLIPIGEGRKIRLPPGKGHRDLRALAEERYGQRLISQRLKRSNEIALGVFTAAAGGRQRFVPLFILRPQVQAPKLLKSDAIFAAFSNAFDAGFAGGVVRRFETARERQQR